MILIIFEICPSNRFFYFPKSGIFAFKSIRKVLDIFLRYSSVILILKLYSTGVPSIGTVYSGTACLTGAPLEILEKLNELGPLNKGTYDPSIFEALDFSR